MRVVAGSLKGRTIKSVKGLNTRPTLDKVKESTFNVLGQFFSNGIALDLYAGSGNLGIEALSRGMDSCIFVDKDYQAIKVIEENLLTLSLQAQSQVYKMTDLKALEFFVQNGQTFDLVFLDPPYEKQRIETILKLLGDHLLLNDEAIIVCETLKEDKIESPHKNIHFIKDYIYGITKITLFKNTGENNE